MKDDIYIVDKKITEKKILIVDDNEKYRSALKRKLSLHGFQSVVTADSPEPVLRALDSEPADVILLDIYMRENERTGIDLLRTIRGRGFQMLIAMVSGDDSPDTFVEALEAGADDYWVKDRSLNIAGEIESLFTRPRYSGDQWTPLRITSLGYLRTLNLSDEEIRQLALYVEDLERQKDLLPSPHIDNPEKPAMKIVLKIFKMLEKQ